MRKDLMEILACPMCKSELTLTIDEEQGDEAACHGTGTVSWLSAGATANGARNNSSPAFAGEGDRAERGGGAAQRRRFSNPARFARAPPPGSGWSPSPRKRGEDFLRS